jgi:hypothetical protein
MADPNARLKPEWRGARRAIVAVLAHLCVAMMVLLSIRVLEMLVSETSGDIIFFRGSKGFEFSAQWLFDAANLGVLLTFLFSAIGVSYSAFRGYDE